MARRGHRERKAWSDTADHCFTERVLDKESIILLYSPGAAKHLADAALEKADKASLAELVMIRVVGTSRTCHPAR